LVKGVFVRKRQRPLSALDSDGNEAQHVDRVGQQLDDTALLME